MALVPHRVGDAWQIIDAATIGQLTYGDSFAVDDFTVGGDGLWLSNDGKYAFDQDTGYLTAVPEPESWAALLSALALAGITLKRRNR